ncbi:MAG: GTPase Era [Kiritimatiellae bacterium]|nr:GTPase Era [Kiritimatiellia bacterium]
MKIAVVGVVGRTNAGKSTLVNSLVGEKVSIVSPVEQTTRNTIRAIVSEERGQLVLLDTPGLHKAVGELGRLLNRMARRSAAGVDITCVVFDAAQKPCLEDIGWMQRIAHESASKVIFVLNKADKRSFNENLFREAWAEVLAEEGGENPPPEPKWVKCISVDEGGSKGVLDALFEFAEEGEPLFDEDTITDYPRRLTIADVIREKYIAKLFQELPHELGIVVRQIEETPEKWLVKVDVLVNRESQKPIAIGRGAETVRYVRKGAERELKEIYGIKVSLDMTVRISKNWMKNPVLLREMGYMGDLV